MPFFNKSPLEYPANGFMPIRTWRDTRAPTAADYKQFIASDMWLDDSSNDWWICCYKDSTQAIWRKMAGTSAAAETFIPDAGTSPVVPTAANQISMLGGTGITSTGGLNTITWDLDADVLMTVTAEDATVATPALNNLNIVGTATNGINTTAAGSTLTISMASPFEGNFAFENNTVGADLDFWVENYDVGGYAAVNVQTPDAGEDPHIWWSVLGGEDYALGIDNSVVGDPLKLTDGITPSAGNILAEFYSANTFGYFYYNALINRRTNIGTTVSIQSINLDDSNIASHATLGAAVQPGGGIPYLALIQNGGFEWNLYNDTTAAGTLTMSFGTFAASTPAWKMTYAGERTLPLQPAFCAWIGNTVNGVTGNGTVYIVNFDTEIYDVNADYNAGTFTFTAPVTGKYFFSADVMGHDLVNATFFQQSFITSNRTYIGILINANVAREPGGDNIRLHQSISADMDAADTCYVTIEGNGQGADNIDVLTDAERTHFTGFLAC